MPDRSPYSRFVLGASLSTAVVLMIAVAFSRPPISKQSTQSLRAHVDAAAQQESNGPLRPLISDMDPAGPETKVNGSPASEPPPAVDSAASGSSQDTAPGSPAAPPSPPQDPPAADATAEPMQQDTPQSPPVPESSAPAKSGDPVRAPEDPDSPDAPRSATQRPKQEGRYDREAEDRLDPLKRLSREFARRAAARGGEPARATPAAPPAHEIFPPTVVMSREHRQSCLVFVGDTMPDGELPCVTGELITIRQALRGQLAAIVFWNAANPYALDQFEELPNDLVPFRQLGVFTIAVHVGPEPANYAELCQQFGQGVLCLTDADKSYFRKVAQGNVPRTYLLDATGKIYWLDIEYSRSTRYDMRNALHYTLQDKNAEDKNAEK